MNNAYRMGTVSHATLRNEDLIPAFVAHLKLLLKGLHGKDALPQNIAAGVAEYQAGTMQADEQSEFIGELMDALNDEALPYFYFGAHPGDGADFGFWLHEDWQQMAKDDGVLFVEDTADIPTSYVGTVALVNDHGNVTLYHADHVRTSGKLTEIWAIV